QQDDVAQSWWRRAPSARHLETRSIRYRNDRGVIRTDATIYDVCRFIEGVRGEIRRRGARRECDVSQCFLETIPMFGSIVALLKPWLPVRQRDASDAHMC